MSDFLDDDEQAQQARDLALREAETLKALKASLYRPLNESEAMAIAYEAGVANSFFKEIRT